MKETPERVSWKNNFQESTSRFIINLLLLFSFELQTRIYKMTQIQMRSWNCELHSTRIRQSISLYRNVQLKYIRYPFEYNKLHLFNATQKFNFQRK